MDWVKGAFTLRWVEHWALIFYSQQVTWNVIMCIINYGKHLIDNIPSKPLNEQLSHQTNSCVKYDKLC